ncbi:MAG TPA: transglycosylase family protein [Marmoricola sp.]|nr:transglycosylase family protein [Marmoricola sp.]
MPTTWKGRLLAARILLVTLLGVAALLTAAPAPASAATLTTWNRLAHCESTSRWHINTHNGYYGGLQISRPTWRGYGGRHFARLPNRATKHEQIRVAERIRRGQGWGAWPVCSRRIGLR